MPTLTAVRELRYAGRNILPGGQFEASEKDAKVLKAIGKATEGQTKKSVDLPAEAFAPKTDEPSIETLRERYQETVGRRPFMGWDATTLNEKIATYQRRDMRAEG